MRASVIRAIDEFVKDISKHIKDISSITINCDDRVILATIKKGLLVDIHEESLVK